MTTKHTPGPWVIRDGGFEPCEIVAESENRGLPVARVWSTDFFFGKANARLIAAAPDLLTACRFARDVVRDTQERMNGLDPAMNILIGLADKIDALIAKAEGRAT